MKLKHHDKSSNTHRITFTDHMYKSGWMQQQFGYQDFYSLFPVTRNNSGVFPPPQLEIKNPHKCIYNECKMKKRVQK
jgi:hypothetical protein